MITSGFSCSTSTYAPLRGPSTTGYFATSSTGKSCRLSAIKHALLRSTASCQQLFVSFASAGLKSVSCGMARKTHQVFHRLVRRPIGTQADRVMREDKQRVDAHECCHADGRTRVVTENKERRAKWDETAVRCHAIDCGAHTELTHAEEDVLAGWVHVKAW